MPPPMVDSEAADIALQLVLKGKAHAESAAVNTFWGGLFLGVGLVLLVLLGVRRAPDVMRSRAQVLAAAAATKSPDGPGARLSTATRSSKSSRKYGQLEPSKNEDVLPPAELKSSQLEDDKVPELD